MKMASKADKWQE